MDIRAIARNRTCVQKAVVPAAPPAVRVRALVFLLALALVLPALAAEPGKTPVRRPPVSTFGGKVAAMFGKLWPGKATKTEVVRARPARSGEAADFVENIVEIPSDPYRDGTVKNNKLTAGDRALHVRWRGGEAPFRLWLLRKGPDGAKSVVLPERLVPGRTADLPPLALTSGDVYVLLVKDAPAYAANPDPLDEDGPRTEMDLEIVPEAQRPAAMPKDFVPSAPEALRYPLWLSDQGDGEWTFEAMQLAAPRAAAPDVAAWLSELGGE